MYSPSKLPRFDNKPTTSFLAKNYTTIVGYLYQDTEVFATVGGTKLFEFVVQTEKPDYCTVTSWEADRQPTIFNLYAEKLSVSFRVKPGKFTTYNLVDKSEVTLQVVSFPWKDFENNNQVIVIRFPGQKEIG